MILQGASLQSSLHFGFELHPIQFHNHLLIQNPGGSGAN
jgi:hypothetical protein